jgi:S-adenosylmethionine decarboxylase
MEIDWVGYDRKNLTFPDAQQWPHSNFGDEIQYLRSHSKLQDRLKGSGYILGPITGDHWFVFVADHSRQLQIESSIGALEATPDDDRTLNMMVLISRATHFLVCM